MPHVRCVTIDTKLLNTSILPEVIRYLREATILFAIFRNPFANP